MEIWLVVILQTLLVSTWACIILDRLDKIKDMLRTRANVLGPNDLCPLGWAWCIGGCDFMPESGNCDDCDRDIVPITKEVEC